MNRIIRALWDFFRYSHLYKKILFLFLPVVIFPLIILSALSSHIVTSATVQKAIENNNDKLKLVSSQIDLVTQYVELSVKMFSTDPNLQDAMKQKNNKEVLEDIKYRSKLHGVFYGYKNKFNYIDNAILINSDGRVYDAAKDSTSYLNDKAADLDIYKYALEKKGQITWKDYHNNLTSSNANDYTALNLSKAIIDVNTGDYLGILSIDINENVISSAFANMKNGRTGEYFVVNANGYIVSSITRDKLYKSISSTDYFRWIRNHQDIGRVFTIDHKSILVTSVPMENLNWYLVSTVPIQELTEENYTINMTFIAIGFIFIIVTIFISYMFSRNITNPIIKLVRFTKRVSAGDLESVMTMKSKDEISELANHFNLMITNIRGLISKNELEQRKKREYELSLLQSQVNPHFLYNTIDNLRSLAINGDTMGAYELATNLGSFYKRTLSSGRDIISVQEEIALTESYMKIQKTRHADLFKYELSIDERVNGFNILKLTLQPIVENSIQHGFRGRQQAGLLVINGYIDHDTIILEVIDNGKGMDKKILDSILTGNEKEEGFTSFGLHNLNERIKLQFGESYGITITSEPAKGTKVTVFIPAAAQRERHNYNESHAG